MQRAYLLLVTALLEVGAGLLLLFVPALPLALLLGVKEGAPETMLVARIAGAALLAIGVACWVGRGDDRNLAQQGLLIGVFLYDAAAAGLLVYAALFLSMAGPLLWPGVVLHSGLAVWSIVCLWEAFLIRHPDR
jgi:hypothetical protein